MQLRRVPWHPQRESSAACRYTPAAAPPTHQGTRSPHGRRSRLHTARCRMHPSSQSSAPWTRLVHSRTHNTLQDAGCPATAALPARSTTAPRGASRRRSPPARRGGASGSSAALRVHCAGGGNTDVRGGGGERLRATPPAKRQHRECAAANRECAALGERGDDHSTPRGTTSGALRVAAGEIHGGFIQIVHFTVICVVFGTHGRWGLGGGV